MSKATSGISCSACVALAVLWSSAASGMMPATSEQMVCVPAVFLVATVAEGSPSVSIPQDCMEDQRFCVFKWPLTIKVDHVLAARPSNFSSQEKSGLQRGRTLYVEVKTGASKYAKDVAPDNLQGNLLAALFSGDGTSLLRNRKFIFGLLDFGDRTSQIWSMSFQARLETVLIRSAGNGPSEKRQCPRLN